VTIWLIAEHKRLLRSSWKPSIKYRKTTSKDLCCLYLNRTHRRSQAKEWVSKRHIYRNRICSLCTVVMQVNKHDFLLRDRDKVVVSGNCVWNQWNHFMPNVTVTNSGKISQQGKFRKILVFTLALWEFLVDPSSLGMSRIIYTFTLVIQTTQNRSS